MPADQRPAPRRWHLTETLLSDTIAGVGVAFPVRPRVAIAEPSRPLDRAGWWVGRLVRRGRRLLRTAVEPFARSWRRADDRRSATHCRIPGNDWAALVPGVATTWTPTATVSICVPARDPGSRIEALVRCLELQTYPAALIEVIVADDGSLDPVRVPDRPTIETSVVRLDRTDGFGAGRARNAAAARASGDIVVFLDADVVPDRHVIESYARWFDRCDLVSPTGICRFVELDRLADDRLLALVASGGLGDEFAAADVDDQAWREQHFARTSDLRIERIDAFRSTIGATIAVGADLLRAVGGFPEFGVRGVEDTVFGYRLQNEGAIMVLDRDATHWHRGRRAFADPLARAGFEAAREPYVRSALPVPGFRHGQPPADAPISPAPVARVRLRGSATECARATRVITDLADGNVVLASDRRDGPDDALCQVDLEASLDWGVDTATRLLDLFRSHEVGVVRVVLGGTARRPVATVVRTRALRRAQRVRPDDPVAGASEMFGSLWVDAASLDLATSGAPVA